MMTINMDVARCANVIEYQCGCKYEYQLIGAYAPIPTPHFIPCFTHAALIASGKLLQKTFEEIAELDWERITSSVRS